MTRVPGLALLLLLPFSWIIEPGWGQVAPGSRIRVTADHSSPSRRVGIFVSLDADSLRYTPAKVDGVVALPLTSVSHLERSAGRRSNAGRGAVIGGLIGGGLGLMLSIAASSDDDGFYEVGVEDVAIVTALLSGTGAGVGALIGTASKRDRWETVPLPTGVVRSGAWRRPLASATVNVRF